MDHQRTREITQMDRQALLAAGFRPTRYEGQDGEFLAKMVKVKRMPHANDHIVDNEGIFGDMEAVTELSPDGRVQLYIADADYLDEPWQLYTEEAQALLRDAAVAA